MVSLREYQSRGVADIRAALAAGKRAPLYVAPTGSGKTVIFSYIAHGAAAKGKRVTILSHRGEIIRQICASLDRFEVPHGVIRPSRTPQLHHSCQVASVQTLVRRLKKVREPDILIIDEAHHATSATFSAIIKAYPKAVVIGTTATPQRLDGRGLGDVFDCLIEGPSVQYLIDNGFLARPIYYAPPSRVDTSKLHITAGDFNRHEIEALMDVPVITGDAVDHYNRICPGKPSIAFCTSIKHCESVAEQFRAVGYRWETIDGNMSEAMRIDRIAALGNGRLHGLCSADLIGEGVDVPVVVAALLLRPTASLALALQQIGRVLRPADGKPNAFIIDHVGNLFRHGLAEETREWTLDAATRRKRRAADPGMTNKQCKRCYAVHAPAPVCPQCGFVYAIQSREVDVVEGTLEQVTAAQVLDRRQQWEVAAANTREGLEAIAKARGHKPAWVDMIMRARAQKEFARKVEESKQGRLL